MITRIACIVALGLVLPCFATADERPNILLILVDDLRWDALGCAGHPFLETPNVDRLADEGVRFADAFVITSLCSPSRATILSGRYTHEHGVRGIWDTLDPDETIFPALLHDAGYETAWVGKWHLGLGSEPHPAFDRWVSFRGQGSYVDPMLNVDGELQLGEGHMTDLLTDFAVGFLEREHVAPWFLAVSHRAAHAPFLPQRRFEGRFGDRPIDAPPSADEDRSQKPGYLECRRFDRERFPEGARRYYELLAGVDESVGEIVASLASTGQLDRTLIVFTSDNGYFLGEHGMFDKRSAYEESIRVPLILRYPAWFEPGLAEGSLALNLDVARTVLEAAGLPAPDAMRGISLRAQALGERHRSEFLYVYDQEQNGDNVRAVCTPSHLALRRFDEKLILYPRAEETPEYYRLREDPHEMHNRIREFPERVAALRLRLVALADSLHTDWADELR